MSRFLMSTWDGGGAFPPELSVVRRLVERGHDVCVLADPTLRAQSLAVGATFAAWDRAPHRVSGDASEDLVKDWETKNPLAGLQRLRDRLIAGPAAVVADETAEQISSYAPDVLLTDYFLFGAIIAGQAANLPVAALMPNIWTLPVRGVPPLAGGFPLATGPLGRCRDAALVWMMNALFARGLPTLNAARAQHGLQPLTSFYDQVLTTDSLLVLTSPSFDYASPFVPPVAHYVGPVLDDPAWAQEWTPAPTEDVPLVLAALSTTFQDQGALLQRIVDALATLPVRSVVTTGPSVDPTTLSAPAHVSVLGSAPHGPILRRASAVITHCGHGTTLKALAAGVPLVCIPMGRDQDDTAARVVHHGAGMRLRPSASVKAIRDATERVLFRDDHRDAARRLARVLESEHDPTAVVTELEALVGHRVDGAP